MHACAEGIHVVEHLGQFVEVLDVFRTTDQLAIDDVRLMRVDQFANVALGFSFCEPNHLKGSLEAHDQAMRHILRIKERRTT